MANENLYGANEVCELLNISIHTLTSWYIWESRQLKEGLITEPYLPVPIRLEHTKGTPKRWNDEMVEALRNHQGNIVKGRNGIYGMYSNPNHSNTRKYKKAEGSGCLI